MEFQTITEKMEGREEVKGFKAKFPLSFWEVTVASMVVIGFVLGLIGVYLTMPASDYSFLKLPRSLEDLQILRFAGLFSFFFPSVFNCEIKSVPKGKFKFCNFTVFCW